MSNTSSKNNNAANQKKSTDNKAITDVEVIKADKVVFEDGDFVLGQEFRVDFINA